MSGVGARLSRLVLAWLLVWPTAAAAMIPTLSSRDVQAALDAGEQGIAQEDFGEEWHVTYPDGVEIVVLTPFARLAHAARRAALKSEPMTDKQRQEQIDRGKTSLQLTVTMFGPSADFPKWYRAALRVGDREVKSTFDQNEATPLRLPDGRFTARNVYTFPLEGLPPRGTVTLIVNHLIRKKEVLRVPLDLGKMR